LPTTTATERMLFSVYPPPNQRGATPHHDCNPAAAGQHYTPLATEKQSRDCKTLSFQWKDERDECIC